MRAQSTAPAANLRAILEPEDRSLSNDPVTVDVEHASGPISIVARDRSFAWSKLRADSLDDVLRDVVELAPIPGLPRPPSFELSVSPRRERAEDHDHSPIIL